MLGVGEVMSYPVCDVYCTDICPLSYTVCGASGCASARCSLSWLLAQFCFPSFFSMTVWTLDAAFGVFIPVEPCGSGYVLSWMDHCDPIKAMVGRFASVLPLVLRGGPHRQDVTLQRTAVECEGRTKPGVFLSSPCTLADLNSKEELTACPVFAAIRLFLLGLIFSSSTQSEAIEEVFTQSCVQTLSSSSQVSVFSKVLPFKFHFSPWLLVPLPCLC